MGTNYIAPIWRMPRNLNKDKVSNYSIINGATYKHILTTAPYTFIQETGVFTFSAFFKLSNYLGFTNTGPASALNIIASTAFGSSEYGFAFYYDNRQLAGEKQNLQFNLYTGGSTTSISVNKDDPLYINDNDWHHVVVTGDGTNLRMYLDNSLLQVNRTTDTQVAIAGLSSTTSTRNLGFIGTSSAANSYPFKGQLGQFLLYDYELTTSQRTSIYNNENPFAIGAAPQGYYEFGSNSNPNANAGYPNLSVGADSVFDFDGSSDYIDTNFQIGTETAYSFSAWFKMASAPANYSTILADANSLGQSSSQRGQLGFYRNFFFAIMGNGSSSWYDLSSYNISAAYDNNWHNITLVINGTSQKLYLDGSLVQTYTSSISAGTAGTQNYTIGRYGDYNGHYFDGELSNVQIWDTALNLPDVEDLYNNGQPLMTGTQPQEANLQAWYKLNQTANYDGGVSGIAFEVDQIGTPDVGGSGDHAYVNPSLSPLSFECQDLNSVGTGSPNYDLAYPVSNGIRWKSLKVYGRYSDLYLSANISLQNGSTSFGYAGARLMYKIDGGSLVVWQDINVNPTDPNSLIAFNPTKSSLSCESSIEIWIECGTSNYSTSRVRIDNVTIKEGGSTGTNIYNEDFSSQSGAGWNGTYTPANSETYVDPVWQIPDNRSAYPQSFEFTKTPQEYIDLGKDDWFDEYNNEITFSFWINKKDWSSTGFEGIISKFGAGGTTIQYRIAYPSSAGQLQFYLQGSATSGSGYSARTHTVTLTSAQQASEWLHVVWRHDASTNRSEAIFNGDYTTAVSLTSIAGNPYAQPQASVLNMIGNVANGLQPFDGAISNYQRFNSYLDNVAVEALYNNGVPSTTTISSSNLKAWYKLDNTETYLKPGALQTANLYEAWLVENQKYPASVDKCLLFSYNNAITYDNFNLINEPELTVSFWYLHDQSVNSRDRVLGSRDSVAHNFYVNVNRSGAAGVSGNLRTNDGAGGFVSNSFSFGNISTPTVGWRLLTVTYNGSVIKAYVNNEEVDSLSATGTVYDLNPYIGGSRNYNQSIRDGNGSADGMRMSNVIYWNKALTPSELTTLYNNGTPLLTKESIPQNSSMLLWNTLENKTETIGGGLYDKSGNSVSIQAITNSSTIIVDNVPVSAESGISSGMTEYSLANNNVSIVNGESDGMNSTNLVQSNLTRTQPYSNYSINFDPGTNEYFPIPSVAGTNIQPDEAQLDGAGFSVSVWVNADDITTAFLGIWQNDGLGVADYSGLSLGINSNFPGAVNIGFSDGNGVGISNRKNYITASGVITAGEWYNIIACYNNPDVDPILYINGVEHTGGFPNTSGTMTTPLGYSAIGEGSIGVIRNAVSDFNGKISNVSIYDHRITAEEALIIYNNGITQDLQNANLPGLIYWWPMDESNTYYDGSNINCREIIVAKDLVGNNSGNVDDIVGNAPGSEASGTGTNLTIADLKGDMYESKINAYSINMADYADGVTNPANSGRSIEVPSV